MKNYELRKFVAPEIITGTDVRLLAGNYFSSLGIYRVFIVSDPHIKQQSWYPQILEHLKHEGVDLIEFYNINANSPDNEVMEGVEHYASNNCQAILAIGGGSVLDSAKGIGLVHSNLGHITDYEGVDKISIPTPPIVCIPTTSGTASDVSQFAIIRDMKRLLKIAVISKSLVPDLTLLDPVVMQTMDQYLTACTGIDALTHAIEAFVSTGSSTMTDFHALNAIKLINDNLELAYLNPLNQNYRFNMMSASLEAGLAFSNASLGAVHALAHSLGGLYNLPHGECNALLLEHVLNINYRTSPEKYNKIGEALGINYRNETNSEKQKIIFNKINSLKRSINIDYSLDRLGVKQNDFIHLAKNAINDPCILTNPLNMNNDDLRTVLLEAL